MFRSAHLVVAAAAFALAGAVSAAEADENPFAERSKVLLPASLEHDRNAARALLNKSLTDLQLIYDQLTELAERSEELVANGGAASACDLANAKLLVIVGFTINKLDGQGRYQDWMEGESLHLVQDYRELIAACGDDASTPASSVISDDLITKL